jgi:hypothetical protein
MKSYSLVFITILGTVNLYGAASKDFEELTAEKVFEALTHEQQSKATLIALAITCSNNTERPLEIVQDCALSSLKLHQNWPEGSKDSEENDTVLINYFSSPYSGRLFRLAGLKVQYEKLTAELEETKTQLSALEKTLTVHKAKNLSSAPSHY